MKTYSCPLCGGRMRMEQVPYVYADVALGRFSADVCGSCGEAFFTEDAWKRIEHLAKEKHLWGIGRSVKVGYSGHSLILRIPAPVAEAADLERGASVFVQPAGKGRLLVERES